MSLSDFLSHTHTYRKAKSTWDKLRRERDMHRMHHQRVVQEKNKLLVDLKRLKAHIDKYEPALTEVGCVHTHT